MVKKKDINYVYFNFIFIITRNIQSVPLGTIRICDIYFIHENVREKTI